MKNRSLASMVLASLVSYVVTIFSMEDANRVLYYHVLSQPTKQEQKDLIILKDSTLDRKDWYNYLLLLFCSIDCTPELAQELLDRGATTETRNKDGLAPLHLAAFKGNEALAKFLLDHGANPNIFSNDELTPLHCAAYIGNPRMVQLLIRHNAETDASESFQLTPSHFASCYKRKDALQQLVQCGSNIEAQSSSGRHPIDFTRSRGIRRFLRSVPTLNTCFIDALKHDQYQDTRRLLQQGAQLNARDEFGNTPLHIAVLRKQPTMLSLLLGWGADPYICDKSGDPAVTLASLQPAMLAPFMTPSREKKES